VLPSAHIACDTDVKRTMARAGEDVDARTLVVHARSAALGPAFASLSRGRRRLLLLIVASARMRIPTEKRHASIYAAGTSLLLALRYRDDEPVERGAHDDLAREARIRLTCGRRAQDAGLP
jgi:hypothetical protein